MVWILTLWMRTLRVIADVLGLISITMKVFFLLIMVFVADLLLLRKVADWRCVIRASRAVCASVTAGLDLGWLGVRAAIFVGLLILCWHVPRLRPSSGLPAHHPYVVVGALRGTAPSVWLPANR